MPSKILILTGLLGIFALGCRIEPKGAPDENDRRRFPNSSFAMKCERVGETGFNGVYRCFNSEAVCYRAGSKGGFQCWKR